MNLFLFVKATLNFSHFISDIKINNFCFSLTLHLFFAKMHHTFQQISLKWNKDDSDSGYSMFEIYMLKKL